MQILFNHVLALMLKRLCERGAIGTYSYDCILPRLASFQACISQGRILTNSSGHYRQSGNPLLILEVIFFMFFLQDILHVLTVDATISINPKGIVLLPSSGTSRFKFHNYFLQPMDPNSPLMITKERSIIYSQLICLALNLFFHLLPS